MSAKKRVLLLTGEEAGYHWALKLYGENLPLHHSRPNQNGAEHQSSSGVTCEGAWPRKTRSGPALGVGPGTVRETRGWGLEAGLLDASEVGSYLRCARSAFQDAVGAGFLLQAELPGLLRLQAGERSEPRLGEGCLFSPLPAPLTVWGGGRGRVVVSLWCFLGNNPFFYLDVSSPIGRDTAPSAAPHQPLPCSVSLGVKMGGGGRCDLRGGCGVLSRLHQLGAKGLSWQVSQWELGGLRPHFPSRRVREALGPAPLFWAQEALRSSRFPVVLILPVFFISPVLNIASSSFLELPVSGCARDAPISAVPGRWGGWSDQSEVW